MALGNGVRRNIAHVSAEERERFRDAIVSLNSERYADRTTKWEMQDRIHEVTHVHGGPAFLPWHRELCNRFETLLREIDSDLSLHYWDWTEDPRQASDGNGDTVNLFTEKFMGSDNGLAGPPFDDFPATNPGIRRNVANGNDAPASPPTDADAEIINSTAGYPQSDQWKIFREKLEGNKMRNHDGAHGYIGGSIGSTSTAFEDPFVFLLHSNVDRLWAMWQQVPREHWRLDPDKVYGIESHHSSIIAALEPWAGRSGLRPWASPEHQEVIKNSKDLTVVIPPRYDTQVVVDIPNPIRVVRVDEKNVKDSTDPGIHHGTH